MIWICIGRGGMMNSEMFEWDETKDSVNRSKHGVSFFYSQKVFLDVNCIIAEDLAHSHDEKRFYCIGKVDGEILTVRFTYRGHIIRIIGAGYWRKGKKIYEEKKDSLH